MKCLQRLHDTSNRIKIWFSFDLRYFLTIKYNTNSCKLLKTEKVQHFFLYFRMLKSVCGNYLKNHWLLDMKMYYWPPIMWPLRKFWEVGQPPRSNGSVDTVTAKKGASPKKGCGHFGYFHVSGKCVTNLILFPDLQLVDSWRV